MAALTTYTRNPTGGGTPSDDYIYTASTDLIGAITPNAVLVRDDAITLARGAEPISPRTGSTGAATLRSVVSSATAGLTVGWSGKQHRFRRAGAAYLNQGVGGAIDSVKFAVLFFSRLV
jgi:hypothetical protein